MPVYIGNRLGGTGCNEVTRRHLGHRTLWPSLMLAIFHTRREVVTAYGRIAVDEDVKRRVEETVGWFTRHDQSGLYFWAAPLWIATPPPRRSPYPWGMDLHTCYCWLYPYKFVNVHFHVAFFPDGRYTWHINKREGGE